MPFLARFAVVAIITAVSAILVFTHINQRQQRRPSHASHYEKSEDPIIYEFSSSSSEDEREEEEDDEEDYEDILKKKDNESGDCVDEKRPSKDGDAELVESMIESMNSDNSQDQGPNGNLRNREAHQTTNNIADIQLQPLETISLSSEISSSDDEWQKISETMSDL